MICTTCGFRGKPRQITKGSIWIEFVLWLFFIVPGLIYSIWRLTTRHKACAKCGGKSVIPIDTPVGQMTIKSGKQLTQEIELREKEAMCVCGDSENHHTDNTGRCFIPECGCVEFEQVCEHCDGTGEVTIMEQVYPGEAPEAPIGTQKCSCVIG